MQLAAKTIVLIGGLFLIETVIAAPSPYVLGSLPFEDCGSTVDLMAVQISSCTTAPCKIQNNSSVTLTAEFLGDNYNTNVLTHEAFWILNTVNTKAAITPELCDGRQCPYKGPDGLAFSVELTASAQLPALRGTLYWRVLGNDEVLVMCFKVPISVTL